MRALGRLERRVMRDYAPVVPLYESSRKLLVAPRIGCVRFVLDLLDLGAVCAR